MNRNPGHGWSGPRVLINNINTEGVTGGCRVDCILPGSSPLGRDQSIWEQGEGWEEQEASPPYPPRLRAGTALFLDEFGGRGSLHL